MPTLRRALLTLLVLRLAAAEELAIDLQRGHQGEIREVGLLPGTGLLLSADGATVAAWELSSRLQRWQAPMPGFAVSALADGGRTLAVGVGHRIELRRVADGRRTRSIGAFWIMGGDGARPASVDAVAVTPDLRWVVASGFAVDAAQLGFEDDRHLATRWFPVDRARTRMLEHEPGAVGTDPPDDIEQPAREEPGLLLGLDASGAARIRHAGRIRLVPPPEGGDARDAGPAPGAGIVIAVAGGSVVCDEEYLGRARWRGDDGRALELAIAGTQPQQAGIAAATLAWLVRDGHLVALGQSPDGEAVVGTAWRWRLPELAALPPVVLPGTRRLFAAGDLLLAAVDGPHATGQAGEPVHEMPWSVRQAGDALGTRLAWLPWSALAAPVAPQPFARLPDLAALDAVACDAEAAWVRSGTTWSRFALADGRPLPLAPAPPARPAGGEYAPPDEDAWQAPPDAGAAARRNLLAFALHPHHLHEISLGRPFQWAWLAADGDHAWSASGTHLFLARPRLVADADGRRLEARILDLVAHEDTVLDAALTPDRRLLVTVGADGVAAVWRLPASLWAPEAAGEPELLYRRLRMRSGGWLAMAPDGIYAGSRDAIDGVLARRGDEVLPVSQVELTHHRPDLLLQRIGLADRARVEALRRAWELRRQRMGGSGSAPPPRVELAPVPPATDAAAVRVEVGATSAGAELARLVVTVDGTPLPDRFGLGQGSPLVRRSADGRRLTAAIEVPLARGLNVIEATAVDADGVEAPVRRAAVNRSGSAARRLVIAAVGVSAHVRSDLDLRHAAGDAQRAAAALAALPGFAAEVHLVRDGEATRERILALRERLAATGPDDVAVLFLAGHGLLDEANAWWFLTHDGDPEHPRGRCVAYHEIEGLLDGIPARRRLLLMDACHAGEVDAAALAPRPGVQVRAVRGLRRIDAAGSAADAELMRDTFVDLRRAAGAVVIAASAGQQVAYEDDRWQGGAFTRALLDALEDRSADADGDGALSAHEWRAAVAERVRALTGGLQVPVQRADNPLADIVLRRW